MAHNGTTFTLTSAKVVLWRMIPQNMQHRCKKVLVWQTRKELNIWGRVRGREVILKLIIKKEM
jgi:hypothetical protein